MIYKEQIQDITTTIVNNYHPDKIILFGSYAKGTANENSDFDVLILLDKDYSGRDENNILDICYEIDLKYNIIIDAHLLSLKELSTIRGKQPIFTNAINSGIYA